MIRLKNNNLIEQLVHTTHNLTMTAIFVFTQIRGKLLRLEYAMKQPRPRGRVTKSEVECQTKTHRRRQGQRIRRAASAPL